LELGRVGGCHKIEKDAENEKRKERGSSEQKKGKLEKKHLGMHTLIRGRGHIYVTKVNLFKTRGGKKELKRVGN